MSDDQTLAVYAKNVQRYAEIVAGEGTPGLIEFAADLPRSGRVLDLGCGPGHAARALMDMGFEVDAFDASPEMVAAAKALGVEARVARFEDVTEVAAYDGIWANFSLLHAPRADFHAHLIALHSALKPGGLLHLGMKLGEGEARDALGRFYTYYSEEELAEHLSRAGFREAQNFRGAGAGLDGTRSPWIWIQAERI